MSGPPVARVHLEIRSERELVQLARLVVAGVATVSHMELEEAEDCRAAIDEMCSSLVESAAPGAIVEIDIVSDGHRVEVTGGIDVTGTATTDEVRREISEMILEAVTDEHQLDLDPTTGRATFRFVREGHRPDDRFGVGADQRGTT